MYEPGALCKPPCSSDVVIEQEAAACEASLLVTSSENRHPAARKLCMALRHRKSIRFHGSLQCYMVCLFVLLFLPGWSEIDMLIQSDGLESEFLAIRHTAKLTRQ